MREKKRDQMLNLLCTQLADAELAGRGEKIMHLMHNARRASSNREIYKATEYCVQALKQLRKVRHTLRIAGAEAAKLAPVECAIAQLEPIYDEARKDGFATLFVDPYQGRFYAGLMLLVTGLIMLYAVGETSGWFQT